MNTHPAYFHPKHGGSMYLRNVDNTTYIHTVLTSKSRINSNNSEPPCKIKISNKNVLIIT
jgi:hypothetical protein